MLCASAIENESGSLISALTPLFGIAAARKAGRFEKLTSPLTFCVTVER